MISQLEAMGYRVVYADDNKVVIEPVVSEVHFSVKEDSNATYNLAASGVGTKDWLEVSKDMKIKAYTEEAINASYPPLRANSTPELCPAYIHVFGYSVLCRLLRGHSESHQGIVRREGLSYGIEWSGRKNCLLLRR